MSLLVIGTVAFDAIETPFGKTDKIVGGAATFIGMSASYFTKNISYTLDGAKKEGMAQFLSLL